MPDAAAQQHLSLAAEIRIESPRRLFAGLLALCGGACVLFLVTLAARWRAGQSWVWLAVLLAAALAGFGEFWRRGQNRPGPVELKLHEDGLIEFRSVPGPGEGAKPAVPRVFTDASADPTCYRLAPDSLCWPGLYLLRLVRVEQNAETVADKSNPSGTVLIIAPKGCMSESARRSLARYLIWAQKSDLSNAASSPAAKPAPKR